MTVQTTQRRGGGYLERPAPSGLADVLEIILDKGIVIDIYLRVSLVGIELLTVDARIVIASVDTYLRFAEAVNRLDIANDGQSEGLPQLMKDMTSGGAKQKTEISKALAQNRSYIRTNLMGEAEEPLPDQKTDET